MRSFNTSEPNILHQHYTLPRLALIEKGKKMVYDDRYFTIWVPRQSGKSTYFRLLATTLENEGYEVCYVNFENFRTEPISALLNMFHQCLNEFWHLDFTALGLRTHLPRFQKLKIKNMY